MTGTSDLKRSKQSDVKCVFVTIIEKGHTLHMEDDTESLLSQLIQIHSYFNILLYKCSYYHIINNNVSLIIYNIKIVHIILIYILICKYYVNRLFCPQ